MKLGIKDTGGKTHTVQLASEHATLHDLRQHIYGLTGRIDWQLMSGYPARALPVHVDAARPLSAIGVRSGDLLLLREAVQDRACDEPEIIVKKIPDDNSCLFNAVGYLLEDHRLSESGKLRALVADIVMQDPSYDAATLGRPKADYGSWIQKKDAWGGAIELAVFSEVYQVQIASIDIQTSRMDVFGEAKGYTDRIYLLYSGIHYDALVSVPFPDAPEAAYVTVFSAKDDAALTRALRLAQGLRERHQYTDTHQFTLTCDVCRTHLVGQTEARAHAKTHGHDVFSEYMQ